MTIYTFIKQFSRSCDKSIPVLKTHTFDRSITFRIIHLFFFILMCAPAFSQQEVSDLKKLSLEELLDIEVTLVSKHPERLITAASAIQVITYDDIKRSASTRLPEALQLASNLQVAQASSHGWAITARGFNGAPLTSNSLADKLLVMIDGRSIYTPLFAGVFWDVQNVLLDDIEKIEVVSGPGGTLWGANAVNGVINIQRKKASNTQGLLLTASGGSFLNHQFGVRYGGKAGEKLFYRVYADHMSYDNTYNSQGKDATDDWSMTQAGFRMDYQASAKDLITFQGDFYAGKEHGPDSTFLDGQNLLGRWEHTVSKTSEYRLQLYFDRTWRDQPLPTFSEQLTTYDADFQHTFRMGRRHQIIWGAGYRYSRDQLDTATSLILEPTDLGFDFSNLFIQDEIKFIKDRLKLIMGVKLTENYFSGAGIQPSARVAWSFNDSSIVWAAVSRALRSSSRFDANVTLPIRGKENFNWEKLTAFETGYRVTPLGNLSLSLALFYNIYADLRSLEFINGSFAFGNNQKATSFGGELSGTYRPLHWWKIRGGYTYLNNTIEATGPHVVKGADRFEAIDPHHMVLIHSVMNLPYNFGLDVTGRYTDKLPAALIQETLLLSPSIPSYFTLNVQASWTYKNFVFSVAGRNLLSKRQQQFGYREIPGNIYGKITWRL